jgi:Tfp pilus assembly PilM family ATPase
VSEDSSITHMRVDDIVDVVRRQASSFETSDYIRIRSIRLTGGEMCLYGLRITLDISAQAQVEDHACGTASDAAGVLNQET